MRSFSYGKVIHGEKKVCKLQISIIYFARSKREQNGFGWWILYQKKNDSEVYDFELHQYRSFY